MFILEGKLRYTYSTLGIYCHDLEGIKISHGDLKITMKHTMKEARLTAPSIVEFFCNDEKVGELDIEATASIGFTAHETFDVGGMKV